MIYMMSKVNLGVGEMGFMYCDVRVSLNITLRCEIYI